MSHFTVTVALPGSVDQDNINDALTHALEPFDENQNVDRYVEKTKEDLIATERKRIESYRDGLYAEYLSDPTEYIARHRNNNAHIAYITGNAPDGGFPAQLTWTDEQIYDYAIRFEEPENIGPDGEVYSTYNPQSKWDWWKIGGRWGGLWTLRESVDELSNMTQASAFGLSDEAGPGRTDVARIEQIAPESMRPTFALIDLQGDWHESGEMGWFGIVSNKADPDEWNVAYTKAITAMPRDTWLLNVDCHI